MSLLLESACANGQEMEALELKKESDFCLERADVEGSSFDSSRSSVDLEVVILVAKGQPTDDPVDVDEW